MSAARHFLELDQIEPAVLRDILALGLAFKNGETAKTGDRPLEGKSLAMIFEKPSTRTRVSFEVGMTQLGGKAVVLTPTEMQIGRGETIADTARVLSRYVDAVLMRTNNPDKLSELAHHSTVPVINGLTDRSHPCQLMADVMTFEQHRGPIAGRKVAWSGDGNNMAYTWTHAAARFGFELRLACPAELSVPAATVAWARAEGATIIETEDPREAADGADCVVTDAWVSMGDQPGEHRHNLLSLYRVDDDVMARAAPDALFMHCLPAHRGEEVTASVIDGPQSVVWDEAENRLHAQKGILTWCMV
jgi:ornithine carbamoyltransferase